MSRLRNAKNNNRSLKNDTDISYFHVKTALCIPFLIRVALYAYVKAVWCVIERLREHSALQKTAAAVCLAIPLCYCGRALEFGRVAILGRRIDRRAINGTNPLSVGGARCTRAPSAYLHFGINAATRIITLPYRHYKSQKMVHLQKKAFWLVSRRSIRSFIFKTDVLAKGSWHTINSFFANCDAHSCPSCLVIMVEINKEHGLFFADHATTTDSSTTWTVGSKDEYTELFSEQAQIS